MSQYRDDRDAARHRIEALEAKLAERDAELSARAATLSVREAEIGRLRRELDITGAVDGRGRPLHTAWATRVTGMALGFAAIAGAVGVVALRAPASASGPPAASAQRAEAAMEAPILADPTPMRTQHDAPGDTAAPVETAAARPDGRVWGDPVYAVPNEEAMRRALEPKVWSGKASRDEIKMLKAICSHLGDRTCRDRAAAALQRSIEQGP
jgi:Rieske Fe-S protein